MKPQKIILDFKSQLQIYYKRKIASEKQDLERKCVLQESCKTGRDLLCLSREITA